MENYDHIILTDEEKREALRLARKRKHFAIQSKKYWDKVNAPVEYPRFDSEQMYFWFEKSVKTIQSDFKLNEYNRFIISLLSYYFSEDPRFEENGQYSLNKGIMLVGPVGCGKTTIMRAFQVNPSNGYAIVSSRRVSEEYTDKTEGGNIAIDKYSNLLAVYPRQNFGQSEIGYCFDDLGTENAKKHFGNEVDVMGNIILNRYDLPGNKNKTHFTANLAADEIEELYGPRVRSRLREMCNFIEFSPNSPDYRR
ncbi:hypothetical protein [Parapedobacter indicus]|nr:hypothetical protein [Parapedobacter indicus]